MKMNAGFCTCKEITQRDSTDCRITEEVWQKMAWGLDGQQDEQQ